VEETTDRRARVIRDRRERRERRPHAVGPEGGLGLHAQREEGSGPLGREAGGAARPCWLPAEGRRKGQRAKYQKESFFSFSFFFYFKVFSNHFKSI